MSHLGAEPVNCVFEHDLPRKLACLQNIYVLPIKYGVLEWLTPQ